MKYLKRYKIYEALNLQYALSSIESEFSFDDVQEMYEDWVDYEVNDDDFDSDEYEDKMHYYELNSDGTAESNTCDDMINWYTTNPLNQLTQEEEVRLRNALYHKYFISKEDLKKIKRNTNKVVTDAMTGVSSLHVVDLSTLGEINNDIDRISLFVNEFDYNKYKKNIPNIKNIIFSDRQSQEIGDKLMDEGLSISGDFDTINIQPSRIKKLTLRGHTKQLIIASRIQSYDIDFVDKIIFKYYIDTDEPSKEVIDYLSNKCNILISNGKLLKVNDKEVHDLENAFEKATLDYNVTIMSSSGDHKLSVKQCIDSCYSGRQITIKLPNKHISSVSKVLEIFEYLDFDMSFSDTNLYLYYNQNRTF